MTSDEMTWGRNDRDEMTGYKMKGDESEGNPKEHILIFEIHKFLQNIYVFSKLFNFCKIIQFSQKYKTKIFFIFFLNDIFLSIQLQICFGLKNAVLFTIRSLSFVHVYQSICLSVWSVFEFGVQKKIRVLY
jgi:hypothetical protein